MNHFYLDKLEYNKILEKLATYCHTYLGKNAAFSLLPKSNKEEVQNLLLETSQAISLLDRASTPPI